MSQPTTESLFGNPEDGSDFFSQLTNQDEVSTSGSQPQNAHQNGLAVFQDPYWDSSGSNGAPEAQADPYAIHQGTTAYTPNHTNGYSYSTDNVHLSSRDPYYQGLGAHQTQTQSTLPPSHTQTATSYNSIYTPAKPEEQKYDPYAPVASAKAYSQPANQSYYSYYGTAQQTAAVALPPPPPPQSSFSTPAPPPPVADASKYRVAPNAYDPPIRQKPGPKPVPRPAQQTPVTNPFGPDPSIYMGGPPQANIQQQMPQYYPQANSSRVPPPPQPPAQQVHRTPSIPPFPANQQINRAPSLPPPPVVSAAPAAPAPPTYPTVPLNNGTHHHNYVPRTSSPLVPRPPSGAANRPPSAASNASISRPPSSLREQISRPGSAASTRQVTPSFRPPSVSYEPNLPFTDASRIEEDPEAEAQILQVASMDLEDTVTTPLAHQFSNQSADHNANTNEDPFFSVIPAKNDAEDSALAPREYDSDRMNDVPHKVSDAPAAQEPASDPYASFKLRSATLPSIPSQLPVVPGLTTSAIQRPSSASSARYAPSKNTINLTPAVLSPPQQQLQRDVLDLTYSPPSATSQASVPGRDPYLPNGSLQINSKSSPYLPPNGNAQYPGTQPTINKGIPEPAFAQYATVPMHTPASNAAYAPSPSLLGTNDPLGRTSVRIPIMSFGFGGSFVTCFPRNESELGGFDVSMSGRPATAVSVRSLKDILKDSTVETSPPKYPGPLFGDSSVSSGTSMLATTATVMKAKKTAVLQYLDSRISEAEQGLSFFSHAAPMEQGQAQGRLLLAKILKILVEHDGKLSGSPAVEQAVKSALLGISTENEGEASDSFSFVSGEASYGAANIQGTVVSTSSVTTTSLDHLQELLVKGARRQACNYALDQRLWAHALLIASGLGQEAWRDAVSEFVRAELPQNLPPSSSNWNSLKLAYGLLAGDGVSAFQNLAPSKPLGQSNFLGVQPQTLTPLSPSFNLGETARIIPTEVLSSWQELLATALYNQSRNDSSGLISLAEVLTVNGWVDAAHCCLLLSLTAAKNQNVAPFGGRSVLLGSVDPIKNSTFHTDLTSIINTEILEFAFSLVPVTKGHESFSGLPYIQPYRLWHAICLAESGDVSQALKYTEAINATLKIQTRHPVSPTFQMQLKELHDRLSGTPHADSTKTWMGRNLAKPSMGTLSTWVQGGLNKLIEGDEPSPRPEATQEPSSTNSTTLGPFSHYSAISSNTPSKAPSPSPSMTNVAQAASLAPPPPRAASGTNNRPASAIDYTRAVNRKPSPSPKVSSANAMTTSFSQAGYGTHSRQATTSSTTSSSNASPVDETVRNGAPQVASWWGDSNGLTPTASSFARSSSPFIPAPTEEEGPQFVSVSDLDEATPAPPPIPYTSEPTNMQGEDEEDLGFGNKKKKVVESEDESNDGANKQASKATVKGKPSPISPPAKETATNLAPAVATPTSGGWFSWLRRSDTPKPIKANLGETESSFFFDPELKKWVNRKAAEEVSPPPRAQTASPSRMASTSTPLPPPPPRAATTVPATAPVPASGAPPPRAPSTNPDAVTPGGISRPPSTVAPPPPGQTPPPPPSRSSTPGTMRGGAKKGARNRYVDVFQQA